MPHQCDGLTPGSPHGAHAHCLGSQSSRVQIKIKAVTLCQGPCVSSLGGAASSSDPEVGTNVGTVHCTGRSRHRPFQGASHPDPDGCIFPRVTLPVMGWPSTVGEVGRRPAHMPSVGTRTAYRLLSLTCGLQGARILLCGTFPVSMMHRPLILC